MNKIAKFSLILLGFLFLFFVKVPSAHACKCAPTDSIKVEAIDSKAVFTGKVTQVEPIVNTNMIRATFAVLESFKGVATSVVVVKTNNDSTACGYEFHKGEDYLIYASGNENNLSTYLCSRTRVLSRADEDLAVLRKLSPGEISSKIVVYPPEPPFPLPGWPELLVKLLGMLLGILSVAMIVNLLVIRLVRPTMYKALMSRHRKKSHVIILTAMILILFVVLLFGLGWLERLLLK